MSPEINPQLFSENGQTIKRPIAFFARAHTSQIHIESDHVRAYVGSRLMLRDNPYFYRGEKTALTGLESYLIGRTSNPMEVAEEIGTYGYKMIKSLEVLNGPYVIPRVKRLITTARISTNIEERQKDLQVLLQTDLAIGNVVRRLQVGMTKEGEDFRTETYRIIGNPIDRFDYSLVSQSESLVLPQTVDTRRQIDVKRQPLDEVLMRLPIHLRRGYNFFSDLLKPVLSAPVERAFLLSLRTARI